MFVAVDIRTADHDFELLVAHDGVAPAGVKLVDVLPYLQHQGIGLVNGIVPGEAEIGIDPVGDRGGPPAAVHGDGSGPVQDGGCVENIVDLLVLQHAVGMDAGAGYIEVTADEGLAGTDFDTDLALHEIGDLGDCGEVHSVGLAPEGFVLNRHGLQRTVARALADAQQAAVDAGTAVEPGGGGVGNNLVEVVVAVPFQLGGGYFREMAQAVDDAGTLRGRAAPG